MTTGGVASPVAGLYVCAGHFVVRGGMQGMCEP